MHSCKTVQLAEHFEGKELAKEIFDHLLAKIKAEVGQSEIVSLPCCVHLFGTYDYLAALPKKDKLEIRFTLNREVKNNRVNAITPVSSQAFKHSIDLYTPEDVDEELLGWIKESYNLRG